MPRVHQDKTTRQHILEAAIDLFSRRGFSAVSVREIARAVGIKEGSIYNHFAGKDEILAAILELFQAELARASPPAPDPAALSSLPPAAIWRQVLAKFKEILADRRMERMVRIIAMEQYRNENARDIILEGMLRGPVRYAEEIFKILAAQGRIKPLDPRMLAVEYQYPMYSMLLEYVLLKNYGQDTAACERMIEERLAFFWGLSGKKEGEKE